MGSRVVKVNTSTLGSGEGLCDGISLTILSEELTNWHVFANNPFFFAMYKSNKVELMLSSRQVYYYVLVC